MKPMRMTDVPFETAENYINDDDWVLEQKLDGARALVIYDSREEPTFTWLASAGTPLKFAAAAQHIPVLEKQLKNMLECAGVDMAILDGELIVEDGTYYIFDCPQMLVATLDGSRVLIREDKPYGTRKMILENRLDPYLDGHDRVFLVETAWGLEEKQDLWRRINEANVEGGMAKHKQAVYAFGTRTKEMVKLKLVKTADVVVTYVERTFKADGVTLSHGKAELAVPISYDDDPEPWINSKGKRVSLDELRTMKEGSARRKDFSLKPRNLYPVGNASLIGKDLTIEIGSVVEVAYLYFQEAMIQPRILRKRLEEEKTAADCTMAQFPEYSRERV